MAGRARPIAPMHADQRGAAPGAAQAAVIRGRVVADDTGEPVAAARVLAQVLPTVAGQRLSPVETVTDAAGRFELREVPPGRLNLSAGARGFTTSFYRPTSPSQAPALRPGQVLADITIRLRRSATLSGVVRDPAGRPAAYLQLTIYRRGILTTRRAWLSIRRPVVTDAAGRYVADDLAPGDYVVAVPVRVTTIPGAVLRALATRDGMSSQVQQSLEATRGPLPGAALLSRPGEVVLATNGDARFLADLPGTDARAYHTTYYPGVSTLDAAGVIALAGGERRDDADVTIGAAPAREVRGRLRSLTGEPAAFVGVRLIAAHAAERSIDYDGEAALTVTDDTGAFVFRGVPECGFRSIVNADSGAT
jgi:hypothetical protein